MILALTAAAESYQYFAFVTADDITVMKSEGLSMTISDGVLTATNGSETKTFNMSELQTLRFSADATEIELPVTSYELPATSSDVVKIALGAKTTLVIDKTNGTKVITRE